MDKFKLWIQKLFKQDKHSKREKHKSEFMRKHGSTHTCPQCNIWEHDGNRITTEYYCQSTDKRTCGECNFVWRSIFTPAGHTWLEEWTWDGGKFAEKDVEKEMETISKELDACEKKRLDAVDALFWQQMTYVVAGIAVMSMGIFLLEGWV